MVCKKSYTTDDVAYISKNPKYHVRVGSVPRRCTVLFPVPNYICSFHLTAMKRFDGHKCCDNARMDMPKGNSVVTKIYFYLETEQGINKEFRKRVFFKMNNSLGSFLLHYIWDERASVP